MDAAAQSVQESDYLDSDFAAVLSILFKTRQMPLSF
jgi:hypothetical protein